MSRINTAERVSRETSDNFVFQRPLLPSPAAAERVGGDTLQIGTGSGYGSGICWQTRPISLICWS